MIDDLATRFALTVAAFAFLATGLSVLGLFGGDAVRDAAEDLATHLARQLDAISATDGEATFSSAAHPFDVPRTLAGSIYRINVLSRAVHVIADGVVVVRPLRLPVHPFAPNREAYTLEDLAILDTGGFYGRGDIPFVVERTVRWIEGERTYLTFVHLPR